MKRIVAIAVVLTLGACSRRHESPTMSPEHANPITRLPQRTSVETPAPRNTIAPAPAAPTRDVHVAIDATGVLFVEGRAVVESDLAHAVFSSAGSVTNARILIAADVRVPHADVVRVIDTLRAAGFTRFAMQVAARAP